MELRGVDLDKQGRCAHYNSAYDVVGNRCATCGVYWACHACHGELADHLFGKMSVTAADSVLCGACGRTMDYPTYSAVSSCPGCAHPFNPGCELHASLYFEV